MNITISCLTDNMMGFITESLRCEYMNTLCVFIISCDADGSVHKNVVSLLRN